MAELNQEDRIMKAKIQLQAEKPFWAWLISYLKIREEKTGELPMPTMGVSHNGELVYNKKFIDELSDAELKGALAHETCHLIFDHLVRRGNRDPMPWNVSADIIVNAVLLNDGFTLVKGGLNPKHENNDYSIELLNGLVKIDGLLRKSSEEVYDLLPKLKMNGGNGKGDGQGKNGKTPKGWDNHKEGPPQTDGTPTEEQRAQSKEWKRRVTEGATFAKMQGKLPAEIERLVGELNNNKVSWKHLLRRFITHNTFNDWTYSRPNKRSQATGVYLPRQSKENTKVVVAIDTSGSISQEILTQFTTEIVSIAKTLPHVELTVLQCDAAVHELLRVENGNIAKIKNMKPKGGGGTSFIPVFEKLTELQDDTQVLVYFTDGHGDFPTQKAKWTTIWAVTKDGLQDDRFPFGKVVRIE